MEVEDQLAVFRGSYTEYVYKKSTINTKEAVDQFNINADSMERIWSI